MGQCFCFDIRHSQQSISPIRVLFLKLLPPPCAVLLVTLPTCHILGYIGIIQLSDFREFFNQPNRRVAYLNPPRVWNFAPETRPKPGVKFVGIVVDCIWQIFCHVSSGKLLLQCVLGSECGNPISILPRTLCISLCPSITRLVAAWSTAF